MITNHVLLKKYPVCDISAFTSRQNRDKMKKLVVALKLKGQCETQKIDFFAIFNSLYFQEYPVKISRPYL